MQPHDTMKVCRKCGTPQPIESFTVDIRYKDGRYPWCAECRRAWRQGRKEKQLQLQRDWKQRNLDHSRKESREWYHEHRNQELIKRRIRLKDRWHNDPIYRARKNREKKERYYTNPAFARKRKAWWAAHSHKRRALIKGTNTRFAAVEWRALCEHYGNRCLCCGEAKPLTVDHVVPISCGGSNAIDNLQPLCMECNLRKRAKTIDYRLGWEA